MIDIWALYFAKTVAVEVPLAAALAGNREPRKKKSKKHDIRLAAPHAANTTKVPAFWPPRLSWRWRLRAALVMLLANLVSHPLITGALWYWWPQEPGTLAQLQVFIALEICVTMLEALILWLVLPLRLWHAVALSILANGITASMSSFAWG